MTIKLLYKNGYMMVSDFVNFPSYARLEYSTSAVREAQASQHNCDSIVLPPPLTPFIISVVIISPTLWW